MPTLVAVGVWALLSAWDLRFGVSVLIALAGGHLRGPRAAAARDRASGDDSGGRARRDRADREVSGVTITLYQLVAALTLVAVVIAFARGTLKPASSPMDLPVLLFLALVLTAIPAATDPKLAIVASASLVSSGIALFLTVWTVRDIDTAWLVLVVFVVVSAVLGVLAVIERQGIYALSGRFLELWRDGIRARVTFKDPNILGAFLVPASLLSMAWVVGETNPRRKLLMGACSLAATAGLFATLSRGALGGWLGGVVLVIALSRVSLKWKAGLAAAVGWAAAVRGAVRARARPGSRPRWSTWARMPRRCIACTWRGARCRCSPTTRWASARATIRSCSRCIATRS